MFTATGRSPSQRPTKGVAAGGAIVDDVDYRDIPNTQIRNVALNLENPVQASEEMQLESQTIYMKLRVTLSNISYEKWNSSRYTPNEDSKEFLVLTKVTSLSLIFGFLIVLILPTLYTLFLKPWSYGCCSRYKLYL